MPYKKTAAFLKAFYEKMLDDVPPEDKTPDILVEANKNTEGVIKTIESIGLGDSQTLKILRAAEHAETLNEKLPELLTAANMLHPTAEIREMFKEGGIELPSPDQIYAGLGVSPPKHKAVMKK